MGFSNLRDSGSVPWTILNFGGKSPAYFVCLFVLTDAQEKQIGFATLGRERPIGWDIAHVQNNFIDLYPAQ